jgi:hypothetical protein
VIGLWWGVMSRRSGGMPVSGGGLCGRCSGRGGGRGGIGAQQDQIVQVCGAAVAPVVDVVGLAVSGCASAADAAAVAGDQRPPLVVVGGALPAGQGQGDEHAFAAGAQDHRDDGGAGEQVEHAGAQRRLVLLEHRPVTGQVFQFDQYGDLGDPSGCLFAAPAVVRSVRASARRCLAVRVSSREVRPIRVFNASRSAAPATGSRYPSRRNMPLAVSDSDTDLFWCRSSAVWSRASGRH